MRWRYQCDVSVPPLAWCAHVKPGDEGVRVVHGGGVETFPDRFVEGAWNGGFAAGGFDRATVLAGTGAVAGGGYISFHAGTDKLSPLFSVTGPGGVRVSNSPFFAMVMAGLEPEPSYPFYTYDLLRIWRQGLHCRSGALRMAGGRRLGVHFAGVVKVDARGGMTVDAPPSPPPPGTYAAYKQLLVDGVRQVFDNAADPARKLVYRPLSTMSRGYDSSAATVLARLAGCTEVITYRDSRSRDPRSDSACGNAHHLGMACREEDRWAYLAMGGRAEPEFAFITLACMAPLAVFEDDLHGRILVSGSYGDTIWGVAGSAVCDGLSSSWSTVTSGVGVIECRLRVGFLPLAPACIGACNNGAIHRLVTAPEMRQWSIGGGYDRPFPRRLAEEAGLPRASFGIRKTGKSSVFLNSPDRYSPEALEEYLGFTRRQDERLPRGGLLLRRLQVVGRHAAWSLLGARRLRYVRVSAAQRWLPFIFNHAPLQIRRPFCYTFQWSFDRLRPRYASAAREGLGFCAGCDILPG